MLVTVYINACCTYMPACRLVVPDFIEPGTSPLLYHSEIEAIVIIKHFIVNFGLQFFFWTVTISLLLFLLFVFGIPTRSDC